MRWEKSRLRSLLSFFLLCSLLLLNRAGLWCVLLTPCSHSAVSLSGGVLDAWICALDQLSLSSPYHFPCSLHSTHTHRHCTMLLLGSKHSRSQPEECGISSCLYLSAAADPSTLKTAAGESPEPLLPLFSAFPRPPFPAAHTRLTSFSLLIELLLLLLANLITADRVITSQNSLRRSALTERAGPSSAGGCVLILSDQSLLAASYRPLNSF